MPNDRVYAMRQSEIKKFIAQKRQVISAHQTRLNTLEVKAAKYGLDCPAHIEMEIIEIKEKISGLEAEVDIFVRNNNKSVDEVLKLYNGVVESNRMQMLEIRNMMLAKIDQYEIQALERKNIGEISPETMLILVELKRQVERIELLYLDKD